MKERLRCSDIASCSSGKIFFDTNIILSLFTSLTVRQNANEYSKFFGECVKLNKALYIDTHVLSEFVNAYLRFEYKKYLKSHKIDSTKCSFKDYRGRQEGIDAMNAAEAVVKNRLLKKFTLAGKQFCCADISSFSFVGADFNDLIITEICKEHDLVLATDDGDFLNADISVISENSAYHPTTA